MFRLLFRFLENSVDPFRFPQTHTPPRGVWSFLVREFRPLRAVVAASLAFTIVSAAVEIWLIGYAGLLVDTLAATSPAHLWETHGVELLAVAAVVLVVRPLVNLRRRRYPRGAARPRRPLRRAVGPPVRRLPRPRPSPPMIRASFMSF